MSEYTKKTRAAIQRYGEDACIKAYDMHEREGYGGRGVSLEGPSVLKTTPQADAAIDAGREIAERRKQATQ
jgi:hypothetical protein